MIDIRCAVSPFMNTNIYLLCEGKRALLIDPGFLPEYTSFLRDISLDAIFITHEHFDHICSAEQLKTQYHCPLWCGQAAEAALEDPRINMSHYGYTLCELMYPGSSAQKPLGEISDYVCKADKAYSDGQLIEWQGHPIEILATPGHSHGSICILVDNAFLFCGDTLFAELPTGIKWKGSDPRQFYQNTLPRLHALEPSLMVYPGHGSQFQLKDYRFWE